MSKKNESEQPVAMETPKGMRDQKLIKQILDAQTVDEVKELGVRLLDTINSFNQSRAKSELREMRSVSGDSQRKSLSTPTLTALILPERNFKDCGHQASYQNLFLQKRVSQLKRENER